MIKIYFSTKLEKSERNLWFSQQIPLTKVKSYQINHLNRPIAHTEIEVIIKDLPTKKRPGPDSFSVELYLNFKQDLMLILLKYFHKVKTERKLPSSHWNTIMILMFKPHKDPTNKK